MTAEQAEEYLRGYTLHGGLRTWGARMVARASRNTLTMRIDMKVHDRDDDEKLIQITFEAQLDVLHLSAALAPEDYLRVWVESSLRAMINHELAESVKFDGARVREVHDPVKELRGLEVTSVVVDEVLDAPR